MKLRANAIFCLLAVIPAQLAWSSDACSTRAILTAADVKVSDGSTFKTQSFFHSKDAAAIRHMYDEERIIAVEGPLSWTRAGDSAGLGTDFHKLFALGHQYHALMLHFEEIVTNSRPTEQVDFRGGSHRAVSGDYPYGGVVHLIQSDEQMRPAGLLFEFPEIPAITVAFLDWRELDGNALPFHAQIDDGENVFDYHYSHIDIKRESPLWFFEAVDAPDIDELQVYRLHRKLLAAHCLGDADLMSVLSASEVVHASRGELLQSSNEVVREQFSSLFERLIYTEYRDVAAPIIDVSQASDLGWIAANVRAVGSDRMTGDSFDDQWAWVMMVKKIDGVWVHVGNASNRR